MIARLFHGWERRLVAVTTDRVVRPFEWGLDWVDEADPSLPPAEALRTWASRAVADSDGFFHVPVVDDFQFDGKIISKDFVSHINPS